MEEQHTPKFRLRLNLFDTIVLVLALVVGAVILLLSMGSDVATTTAVNTTTATYTIRLQNAVLELEDQVQAGDALEDAIRNLALGTVVSATYTPTPIYVLNEETQTYEVVDSPIYINADIVVTSTATTSQDTISLTSGYDILSGQTIYVRGPGYLGSGIIINIDREGLA